MIKKVFNGLKKLRFGKRKLVMILAVLLLIGFLGWKIFGKKKQAIQYQTQTAQTGTLINSISASGAINSGNYTNLTTKASGVVKTVYVTNGESVVKGQKIAEITLDDYAQERQITAWVAYLSATEGVLQAQADKVSNDIVMWQAQQAVLDAQQAYNDMLDNNTDPQTNEAYTDSRKMIIAKTLDESRLAFLVVESKYLNSGADIAAAGAKATAALRDYQGNSATVVAPVGGVISDLALAPGVLVAASSATSSTSGATIVSPQTIGKISNSEGQLTASVSLTESDVIKVKAAQKVSLTLDAYPENTFTGKVLAVNTSGGVTSGVTSYPVTILLDPVSVAIYPNMAVNAEIIINAKTEVLLIPSSAIKTSGSQSIVQVMKEGKPQDIIVEIGDSNASQTEIISGLNRGDEVVTSTISTAMTTKTQSTSATQFGTGGGFGGGEVRFMAR